MGSGSFPDTISRSDWKCAADKVLPIVDSRKQDRFISIVTVGEIRSLALQNGWGGAKFGAMEAYLSQAAAIDIRVVEF